jgi:hypothetical protein
MSKRAQRSVPNPKANFERHHKMCLTDNPGTRKLEATRKLLPAPHHYGPCARVRTILCEAHNGKGRVSSRIASCRDKRHERTQHAAGHERAAKSGWRGAIGARVTTTIASAQHNRPQSYARRASAMLAMRAATLSCRRESTKCTCSHMSQMPRRVRSLSAPGPSAREPERKSTCYILRSV